MSGPKRNDRSAPLTDLAEHAAALVDLLVDEVLDRRSVPLLRRLTTSRNRSRYGGSTAHRSIRWPAPPSTHRQESSTQRPVSSPRPDAEAVRPSTRRRWIWPCWRWRRTGLHSMLGKRHWSARCAPPGHVCSWRSPPPALGRRPPCAPSLAWTQEGGQVLGLALSAAAAAVLAEQTGIHTDTLANSPGHSGTVSCPIGRQRPTRRHW